MEGLVLKWCYKCGKMKSPDDFHNNKSKDDGKRDECKICHIENNKDYYHNKGGREQRGHQSMYENKACSNYIGLVVGEELARRLFKNVTMMPFGHPGYDMICQNNFRINIKVSTIRKQYNKNSIVNKWGFHIERNKDCDFFLCMAFDNVIDLHPLIGWLIPGNEVNHKPTINISATTIHKWDKCKMNFDSAQQCCNLMKEHSIHKQ